MNNEKLIELVRPNKILYDLSEKDYKNVQKKEEIWVEIGKEIKLPADTCKKRWKSLRDSFKRHKRNSEQPSGSGAHQQKPYKYMETLSFLSNSKDSRETIGNVSISTTDDALDFDDLIIDCSSSAYNEESMNLYDETTTSSQQQNTKKASKRKADTEVTEIFSEMMKECVGAVQQIASCDTEVDSTGTLFQALAKQITQANLPAQKVRQIERKVMNLVYDELEVCENTTN